ncbi:hypothetical protein LCGC14_2718020, partial [marine sediment metagenome]
EYQRIAKSMERWGNLGGIVWNKTTGYLVGGHQRVKVLKARMPEKKKVIVHFTDGGPDNAHHVNRAVKAARDAGTKVYAIGAGIHMGRSLETQYGKGNWETVYQVSDLPQAVGRLLKRLDSFG